jgi:ABC-2 type transport system permease protein
MTLYLFAVTALGVFMATLASSMPQFGMLSVPVYAIAYLLSGAATPIESMPPDLQVVARVLPTTQFVTLSQAILYRGAGIAAVWPQILAITAWGSLFVGLALQRFRAMLARQG